MSFLFKPMRWRDARMVAEWHYPEPYSFYDLGLAPLVRCRPGTRSIVRASSDSDVSARVGPSAGS